MHVREVHSLPTHHMYDACNNSSRVTHDLMSVAIFDREDDVWLPVQDPGHSWATLQA
jgi:hypothetical protein